MRVVAALAAIALLAMLIASCAPDVATDSACPYAPACDVKPDLTLLAGRIDTTCVVNGCAQGYVCCLRGCLTGARGCDAFIGGELVICETGDARCVAPCDCPAGGVLPREPFGGPPGPG